MSDAPDGTKTQAKPERGDAEQAVRYMAIKAAIFILVPLVVAVATAVWVLQ